MLLLCVGPDTFRAQQKARELEEAFKQKHDPSGSSVERVSVGKDGIDEVIQKANTLSLFTPRRFLRATDLLTECPKAKQQILAQALTRDPENVIVVSVEAEAPSATVMKGFADVPKIIKYEFPEQQGAAFMRWVMEIAQPLGIQDQQAIARIAELTDGDSWFAWNELLKLAAGGKNEIQKEALSPTVYAYAEAYLEQRPSWKEALLHKDVSSQLLTPFLSQMRAALRVRDGAVEGLHPYVVKKMQNNKISSPEKNLAFVLRALFMQRAGYADEEEATTLL